MAPPVVDQATTQTEVNDESDSWEGQRRLSHIGRKDDVDDVYKKKRKSNNNYRENLKKNIKKEHNNEKQIK